MVGGSQLQGGGACDLIPLMFASASWRQSMRVNIRFMRWLSFSVFTFPPLFVFCNASAPPDRSNPNPMAAALAPNWMPKLDAQATARLLEAVRQQPDATLAELRDRVGVDCRIVTIFRALKRNGIT